MCKPSIPSFSHKSSVCAATLAKHAQHEPSAKPLVLHHTAAKLGGPYASIDALPAMEELSMSSSSSDGDFRSSLIRALVASADPEFWDLEVGGIVTLPRQSKEDDPSLMTIEAIDQGLDDLFHEAHPFKPRKRDGYDTPSPTTLSPKWEPPSPHPQRKHLRVEYVTRALHLPGL